LGLIAAGVLVVVLAAISIVLIVPIIQEQLAIRDARTELVEIMGGTAVIGTDLMTADPDEREEINPRIPTFQMEIYEVSNKQYQLCVDKGDCSAPVDPEMFLNKLLSAHPVVNVTAAQANTYCEWIGRRLPTELEWEYAARSEAGYEWPWSWKNPDLKKEEACPTGTSTNPINNDFGNDTKGGVRNLCGNVWEWTSSIYTAMGYKEGQETPYWDRDSLALVDLVLVQRGGSFAASIKTITDRRQALPFGGASLDVGFRCVSN
jgi:formylglycine-generating enzyme required for sulfatase activity